MPYRVLVRIGPEVKRSASMELETALDLIELEGRAAQATPEVKGLDMGTRKFEPVQLVHARLELRQVSGEGLIARLRRGRSIGGVDVRGDGSAEAYLGQVRRTLVEQRLDESPYDALRRAVVGGASSSLDAQI